MEYRIIERITRHRYAVLLIITGIGLRLIYFFQNHPLWLDEVNVTLPALYVPFRGFLSGGFSHPTVPIKPALFNIFIKTTLSLFGCAEWSARLWPLTAGCLSVPLFYAVACRFLNPSRAFFALCFFVFSPIIIIFSAEVNTYASDILTVLVISAVSVSLIEEGYRKESIYVFGWVGMLAPWLSYSALLVWTPAAILFCRQLFRIRARAGLFTFGIIAVFWLGSVLRLVQYYVFPTLGGKSFIADRIVHFPRVEGFLDLVRLVGSLGQLFLSQSLGLIAVPLVTAFAVLGGVTLYGKHKEKALFLILPFPVLVAAIALRIYPSFSRSLLFLAPALYVMLAEGILTAAEQTGTRKSLWAVFLTLAMLIHPLTQLFDTLAHSSVKENNRQAMQAFLSRYETGDSVILSEYGLQIYTYYLQCLGGPTYTRDPGVKDKFRGLQKTSVWRVGQDVRYYNGQAYVPVFRYRPNARGLFDPEGEGFPLHPLDPLFMESGSRVWLLLLHYQKDVETFMTVFLSRHATLEYEYKGENAVVYEFNLGGPFIGLTPPGVAKQGEKGDSGAGNRK